MKKEIEQEKGNMISASLGLNTLLPHHQIKSNSL